MFTSRYSVYDIVPPTTDLRNNLRCCSNGSKCVTNHTDRRGEGGGRGGGGGGGAGGGGREGNFQEG